MGNGNFGVSELHNPEPID